MAFMDSYNKLEPLVGYGYQKMWRPSENVRLGAGYSVGIMMRSDFNLCANSYYRTACIR